jgi:beta-glucosidase
MSAVDVPTPVEGGASGTVDIKKPIVDVEPLTPTELTPATTPEEQSPSTANMADKKVFGTEKPDDRARALAATLTLEEQVRRLTCRCGTFGAQHWVFL